MSYLGHNKTSQELSFRSAKYLGNKQKTISLKSVGLQIVKTKELHCINRVGEYYSSISTYYIKSPENQRNWQN